MLADRRPHGDGESKGDGNCQAETILHTTTEHAAQIEMKTFAGVGEYAKEANEKMIGVGLEGGVRGRRSRMSGIEEGGIEGGSIQLISARMMC